MKTTAGLWIDHQSAVIAIVSTEGDRTMTIRSTAKKPPVQSAGAHTRLPFEIQTAQAADRRELAPASRYEHFYAEIVAAIHDAESILIFGPDEAKVELKNHLDCGHFRGLVMALEMVDAMTDRQIAIELRQYFQPA